MARLSNFLRPRDPIGENPSPPSQLVCRPVQKPEIESALRLLLVNDGGLASDEAVLDFLAFAMQRKIDLNQMWIAETGDRIGWALLPIPSPGRTMLLFTPQRVPSGVSHQTVRTLTDAVCQQWAKQDIHLAQFLLDPADTQIRELYEPCGFEVLAELIYLQRAARQAQDFQLPAGFELHPYRPELHRSFSQTILRSYEGSLDCPTLNGKRHIDDVIQGHRATGVFDPTLWHLLSDQGEARGVLILSPATHNESVELVYLGLVPQGRGRGLGDLLMRVALHSTRRVERTELNLAVDSRNTPALRLYYRHGLRRIGTRLALLRDLRSHPVPTNPATAAAQTLR